METETVPSSSVSICTTVLRSWIWPSIKPGKKKTIESLEVEEIAGFAFLLLHFPFFVGFPELLALFSPECCLNKNIDQPYLGV